MVEDSPAFEGLLQGLLLNDATRVGQKLRAGSVVSTRVDCPGALPPALKLSIDKTGVYALSYEDFLALGLDLSVLDSRLFELSFQNEAVPIFIAGEEDGVFGQGDVLFFYAVAADTLYTRSNVYWLSVNPDGGMRMRFGDGAPNFAHSALSVFSNTVHVEEAVAYRSIFPGSSGVVRVFWAQLDPGDSQDMGIFLPYVAVSDKSAIIRVMLQGKTDDAGAVPVHHSEVLLNGVVVGDALWNGQVQFLFEVSVPLSSLLEGDNVVTIRSLGDTAAKVDSVYLNWLEIVYSASLAAVVDELAFEVAGLGFRSETLSGLLYRVSVGGFSLPDLLVLDVSIPLFVVPLLGSKVQADGVGGFGVEFSDDLGGGKAFYAFSVAGNLLKPAEISIDVPTVRLASSCNEADYFVIFHDSFDVGALVSLLEERGFVVMAVRVSDTYDESSGGLPDPQATRDFLSFAFLHYGGGSGVCVVGG